MARHLTADANNGIMEWAEPIKEAFKDDEFKPEIVDEEYFLYANQTYRIADDAYIDAEVSEEGYQTLAEEFGIKRQ